MAKKELPPLQQEHTVTIVGKALDTFDSAGIPCTVVVDPAQVEMLAGYFVTTKEIAAFFGCEERQIKEHFGQEYKAGRSKAKTEIRKAQFEKAVVDKNPAMLIWLGKQMLGQKEPDKKIEVQGLSAVSDDELNKKLADALQKLSNDKK